MINMYAIRIKGTDFFKCARQAMFGTFEVAMQNGVYFNQAKSAEKVIRETMNQLMAQKGYTISQGRYLIYEDGKPNYYTCHQEMADATKDYPLSCKKIELEVVTLSLTIA